MREGWELKIMSEVFDVRDGTHDSPKYQDEGYPLITSKNLKNGKITFDKIKYINKADYNNINKRSKVDIGDVLFAMIGTIGNPTLVTKEPNFAIKNVALFKINNSQNGQYLKYYLESKFVIDKMLNDAKGTTQRFVGLGYLRKFPIPIPTLAEQQQIVDILDKAFTAIDTAKANIEKNIENAKELFQSKLNQIFSQTGDGWEEKTWKEVLEIRSGRNQKEVQSLDGKYPILGSAGKIMAYADKFICEEGTTIIGRKGTINNPMYIETKFWNVDTAFGLHALENLDKRFLYFFCLSYDFTKRDKGSGRPSLVKNDLLKMVMPIPLLETQRETVTICENLKKKIELIETNYLNKIKSLEELKKSILQKAFAGELTSVNTITTPQN
ncbi:restriction endonuclease subunit S [Tenacibaculum halocynthiae]|uniref:restriction endonuclease subunit S n=1 Tax=Tenacibaculum halocynthiae TaxID=1254437 RepID=UPI003D6497A4